MWQFEDLLNYLTFYSEIIIDETNFEFCLESSLTSKNLLLFNRCLKYKFHSLSFRVLNFDAYEVFVGGIFYSKVFFEFCDFLNLLQTYSDFPKIKHFRVFKKELKESEKDEPTITRKSQNVIDKVRSSERKNEITLPGTIYQEIKKELSEYFYKDDLLVTKKEIISPLIRVAMDWGLTGLLRFLIQDDFFKLDESNIEECLNVAFDTDDFVFLTKCLEFKFECKINLNSKGSFRIFFDQENMYDFLNKRKKGGSFPNIRFAFSDYWLMGVSASAKDIFKLLQSKSQPSRTLITDLGFSKFDKLQDLIDLENEYREVFPNLQRYKLRIKNPSQLQFKNKSDFSRWSSLISKLNFVFEIDQKLLFNTINAFPNLETLQFTWSEKMENFDKNIKLLPGIKKLKIEPAYKIWNEGIPSDNLLSFIKLFQTIEELHLSHVFNVTNNDIIILAKANPNLKSICLENCKSIEYGWLPRSVSKLKIFKKQFGLKQRMYG